MRRGPSKTAAVAATSTVQAGVVTICQRDICIDGCCIDISVYQLFLFDGCGICLSVFCL